MARRRSRVCSTPGPSPRFFDVTGRPHARSTSVLRFQDDEAGSARADLHAAELRADDISSSRPLLAAWRRWRRQCLDAFGRAHVILDNLLAEKAYPPMVVVMPNGYAYGWDAGVGGTTSGRLPTGSHRRLIPFVQANYRVSSDPKQRALAGCHAARSDAEISAFLTWITSAASANSAPAATIRNRLQGCCRHAKKVNEKLDVLWVGCGTDDIAMPGANAGPTFSPPAALNTPSKRLAESTRGSSGGSLCESSRPPGIRSALLYPEHREPTGSGSHRHDRHCATLT